MLSDEINESKILSAVAQSCADVVELHELIRKIGETIFALPNISKTGLAIFDEERRFVQRLCVDSQQNSRNKQTENKFTIQEYEQAVEETEISVLQKNVQPCVSDDLRSDRSFPMYQALQLEGMRRFFSTPLLLQDQLLGSLYIVTSHTEPFSDSILTLIEKMGRIITPVLYNCLNHARFARGDRRRDALVELSRVINSSLELDNVLIHGHRIIGSLEGHRASAILLLNDGNKTFRCYSHNGTSSLEDSLLPPPTVHHLTNSVLSWLLNEGTTYESEDLTLGIQFEDDSELRKRDVLRYLAIPLSARGKILGGFIFGTNDPRPRRKVEYWLYENIALQLALAIDNAVKHEQLQQITHKLANQNAYLQDEIRSEHGFGVMIGSSRAMDRLHSDIRQVSRTDATVLITGETGVGKELVAREIHEMSQRAAHPLIKVNCPSIPESMFESELFGHEKGAFTSAINRRIGRFELASDGTLFLDEIGELSLAVQAKLLRVLQDGEFERIGGSKTLKTNTRVIVATNRDLSKAVEKGIFRVDLYYRLNVFPIHIPPLRERREDIPVLVESFIAEFSQRMGKHCDRIDEQSLDDLCQRVWTGNIRELKHVIERAVILSNSPCLQIEHVENQILNNPITTHGSSHSGIANLDVIQAEHIMRALKACVGVIEGDKGAAALLGLKPSTLRFRIKRLGINKSRLDR